MVGADLTFGPKNSSKIVIDFTKIAGLDSILDSRYSNDGRGDCLLM